MERETPLVHVTSAAAAGKTFDSSRRLILSPRSRRGDVDLHESVMVRENATSTGSGVRRDEDRTMTFLGLFAFD